MMRRPDPPLREKLRLLTCLLASDRAAGLTRDDLAEALQILEAFPIDVFELRASQKQLDFAERFFNRADFDGRPLDIFVAMGGNRSGKSIVCGWLCFAKWLRDKAVAGDEYWCVAQNLQRSITGQQKELWQALPRHMFNAWRKPQTWDEKTGFGDSRKLVLPCETGGFCSIEFRSSDQEPSTFEQAKLAGAWVDEKLPEAIYDRLLPRIVDRNGWILYSDIPEQYWHVARLKGAKPSAAVFFQHMSMYDNAHNLPDGAIAKVGDRMTADQRRLRIEGEFLVMEGLVYREYIDQLRPAGHLVRPFAIPAHWPKWRFIDYGGSAPTACGWVALSENEDAFVYREHYEENKTVETNARQIIAASGREQYECTFIDPHAYDPPPVYYSAAETIADQYEKAGITNMTGWPYVQLIGEHAMVQRVKYRLEHRKFYLFETCNHFRRELGSWMYKRDKQTGKPMASDAFEDGNNHLLDGFKGWNATLQTFARQQITKHAGGGE